MASAMTEIWNLGPNSFSISAEGLTEQDDLELEFHRKSDGTVTILAFDDMTPIVPGELSRDQVKQLIEFLKKYQNPA